jgi:hypothetical protein
MKTAAATGIARKTAIMMTSPFDTAGASVARTWAMLTA